MFLKTEREFYSRFGLSAQYARFAKTIRIESRVIFLEKHDERFAN
jgi:hypothetical protein